MEKDGFFGSFNWQCDHTPEIEMEMNNCGGDQLQPSIFVNLNWDQSSTDQTANFESALSSLVSSPSSSNPNPNPNPNLPSFASSADSFVIRELIGRLGNICSSNNNSSSCAGGGDEISPPNSHYKSNNTSCYSTPLNSPPKLNLDHPHFQFARPGGDQGVVPFAADPGFAERAARFSCFGRKYPQLGPSGVKEPGKLSRVSSSKSLKTPNPLHLQDGNGIGGQLENDMITMMMMMRSREELGHQQSSASDQMAPSGSEGNIVRKRKTATASSNKGSSRGKEGAPVNPLKGGDEEHSNSKRSKSVTEAEAEANTTDKDEAAIAKTPKAEQNSTEGESSAQKQGKEDREKESNVKPPEPPKQDYIHVRARRGQATDSHSLAERVRREKISERMKFLQDLVPGCNKVTGKAVMLDEIINYVQSLQRQVEFLSMKLAAVNPRLDFNIDSVLSKDMHQPRGPMMLPQSSYQLEGESTTGLSYANEPHGQVQSLITSNGLKTQCSVNINPLDASSLLGRSLSMQLPLLDGFTDAAASQLGALWEEDLQSVVQMGFGQNQQAIFSTHDFQGPLPTSHMKIEL